MLMFRLPFPARAALAGAGLALTAACTADPAPTAAAPAAARAAAAPPAHGAHGGAPGAALGAPGPATLREIAALRRATARYHRLEAGRAAGWATDVTGCMENQPAGGMGHHFAELPFDASVTVERPEILVYAPGPSGRLELAAVEYAIPFSLWTAAEPPTLYGQAFHRNEGFGLWVLHVWAWRENPTGMFADWNPKVACPPATN
jgi:hypothetical protein